MARLIEYIFPDGGNASDLEILEDGAVITGDVDGARLVLTAPGVAYTLTSADLGWGGSGAFVWDTTAKVLTIRHAQLEVGDDHDERLPNGTYDVEVWLLSADHPEGIRWARSQRLVFVVES